MAIYRIAVWDEVDDFLLSKPTPEEIIAFQAPAWLQQRAGELLDSNREGTLTLEERAELDEITMVERFVIRLKAKALLKLNRKP